MCAWVWPIDMIVYAFLNDKDSVIFFYLIGNPTAKAWMKNGGKVQKKSTSIPSSLGFRVRKDRRQGFNKMSQIDVNRESVSLLICCDS